MTSAVFQSLMNNSFVIRRTQRTSDGQGGWITTPMLIGTVLGRMRPASSSERETAQLEERQISHVLYVPAVTDIARGDEVEGGGLTVEVSAVREPSLAREHLEVDCLDRQFEISTETP